MRKNVKWIASLPRAFRSNIAQLPPRAAALIRYGSLVTAVCTAIFTAYAVCMYIFPGLAANPGYYTLAEYARAFYSNALFALCVTWGGAFFMDCSEKTADAK